MGKENFFSKSWSLYADGFKTMGKLGKQLWLLIAIKLAIMFLILKMIFFPNYLKTNFKSDEERSRHVIENLTKSTHK